MGKGGCEGMKKAGPCLGCTERVVGCHSGCEDYKAYRKRLDELNAKVKAEQEADFYVVDLYKKYKWDQLIRKKSRKFEKGN